jgi:hypothetical protein
MQFDDALANREPQSETIDLACQSRIHTVETLKDTFQVLGRNPLAGIGDAYL